MHVHPQSIMEVWNRLNLKAVESGHSDVLAWVQSSFLKGMLGGVMERIGFKIYTGEGVSAGALSP
eukprot:1139909-Pelagomonas_calceolata.AAC.4